MLTSYIVFYPQPVGTCLAPTYSFRGREFGRLTLSAACAPANTASLFASPNKHHTSQLRTRANHSTEIQAPNRLSYTERAPSGQDLVQLRTTDHIGSTGRARRQPSHKLHPTAFSAPFLALTPQTSSHRESKRNTNIEGIACYRIYLCIQDHESWFQRRVGSIWERYLFVTHYNTLACDVRF